MFLIYVRIMFIYGEIRGSYVHRFLGPGLLHPGVLSSRSSYVHAFLRSWLLTSMASYIQGFLHSWVLTSLNFIRLLRVVITPSGETTRSNRMKFRLVFLHLGVLAFISYVHWFSGSRVLTLMRSYVQGS